MFGRVPLTEAGPDDAAQIDDQDHEGEQSDDVDKELRDELGDREKPGAGGISFVFNEALLRDSVS